MPPRKGENTEAGGVESGVLGGDVLLPAPTRWASGAVLMAHALRDRHSASHCACGACAHGSPGRQEGPRGAAQGQPPQAPGLGEEAKVGVVRSAT